jgi:hypothetical protein
MDKKNNYILEVFAFFITLIVIIKHLFGIHEALMYIFPQSLLIVLFYFVSYIVFVQLCTYVKSKENLTNTDMRKISQLSVLVFVLAIAPLSIENAKKIYYKSFTVNKWENMNARIFMVGDLMTKIENKNIKDISDLLGKDNTMDFINITNRKKSHSTVEKGTYKPDIKSFKAYDIWTESDLVSIYSYHFVIYFDNISGNIIDSAFLKITID